MGSPKTRFGLEGYGTRRAGPFSGRAPRAGVGKLTRFGLEGYGARRAGAFARIVVTGYARPQLVVALDDQLAVVGQDVILRRVNGPDVTVRVVMRAFRPEELVGGITQNDALVILSPTQIRNANWPGVTDTGVSPFNPPVWMPRRNDKIISLGRQFNVAYVKPFVVANDVVRIELTVTG